MDRGPGHVHRGWAHRHALPLAIVMAAILVLGGCGSSQGDARNSEMCQHYEDVAATAEDFSKLDASETSADELQARAIDFRDRLDELQEDVNGERAKTALSNLEDTLDAARDAAIAAGDKAEERVAAAEDSLDEVTQKWARVQALISDRCN